MKRYEVWVDENNETYPWAVVECSLHAFDSSHCNRKVIATYPSQAMAQSMADANNGVS